MDQQTLYTIKYLVKKIIARKIGIYPLTIYISLDEFDIVDIGNGQAIVTGKYSYGDRIGRYKIVFDLSDIHPVECEVSTC